MPKHIKNGPRGLPIDRSGHTATIGSFGELLTGTKKGDVSVQFQYDFYNSDFDLKASTLTGDGAAAVANSLLTVSSASTGTAAVQSRDTVRYRPGHSGYADFTAAFVGTTGVGRAGPFDDDDGFLIEYDNATGVMQFGYRRGGTDYLETVSLPSSFDPSNLNVYRILFGYLGIASPVLLVKLGGYQTLHTVRTEGEMAATHVLNPVFPMCIYAENGMSLSTGSWDCGTFNGSEESGTRTMHFPNTVVVDGVAAEQGEMTLTTTNVGTVIIFHSKTTYKSKDNKVRSRLLNYDFSVDTPGSGSGQVVFQIIGNPTLSGAATYTDIDADNGVFEYDHTASTGASVEYASGGRVLLQKVLSYAAGQGNNPGSTESIADAADRLGLISNPGDVFCVLAKDIGGNGVTVRVELTWEDLF